MILNKQESIEYLEKQQDGMFEIKKKQLKSIRSLRQSRFYWGVVVTIISDYHGMSAIETHEAIKATFKIETTTDLDTAEFKTLIEMIQELWFTKFNVVIPNPNDLNEEQSLYSSLGF